MNKIKKNGRIIETIKDDSMHKAFGHKTELTKVEVFKWKKNLGSKGEFMLIPKKDLQIDLSYQREPVTETIVREIAKNFEWALFGTIIVSYNEKGYYVIDGGHRLRGAFRRDDINELPCIVFCFDNPEEEARIFYYYNNTRKHVSVMDNHKAAKRGGGTFPESIIAIKADNLVKKYGYKFTSNSRPLWGTSAVKTISQSIKKNEIIAEKTFAILAQVAGGDPITRKEYSGLFYLMQYNQNIDFFEFPLKNMLETGFTIITTQIKQREIIEGKGGPKIYARSLLETLNKNQIKNKIIIPD